MVVKKKNPTGLEGSEATTQFGTSVLSLALNSFFVMLAFGVGHGTAHGVPAFGYFQCVFFTWVVGSVIGYGNLALIDRVKKFASKVLR